MRLNFFRANGLLQVFLNVWDAVLGNVFNQTGQSLSTGRHGRSK